MKIIFVGMEYEKYDPKFGHTQEYGHFYMTMQQMGHEVIFVRLDDVPKIGKKKFNRRLQELVAHEKPDVVFVFMFTEEIDQRVMAEISQSTVTMAYISDDIWNFSNYAKYYANCFRYICTTYGPAVLRYEKLGAKVIKTQWGVNEQHFKPAFAAFPRRDFIADVSFVGQWHPQREKIIGTIRRAGIPVVVHGFGWPEAPGRIPREEMIRYFSLSKISLNLNPSSFAVTPRAFARLVVKRTSGHVETDFKNFFNNILMWNDKRTPQLKGRTFEIPACGGFQITGNPRDDLSAYYRFDKEIVVYSTILELIEKIRYYLAPEHEAEREAMAQAAYERTIREHTYHDRITEIFKAAGLSEHV